MFKEPLKETERLIEQRPLSKEVLTAFRDLAGIMAEAAPKMKEVKVDGRLQDIKRDEGFPIFSREDLPLDFHSGSQLLKSFFETLADKERPDRKGLEKALSRHKKDETWSQNLFQAILSHDENALLNMAKEVDLEPDVVRFLAQMALTPSIYAFRSKLENLVDTENWDYGYCPFCGSQPSISFFEKTGKRYLHCELCGLEWRYSRLKCPFCSNQDHKKLGYFDVENQDGFRVDFCRQCGRYIKAVDKRVIEKAAPMELENLATLHLDILAKKEGLK